MGDKELVEWVRKQGLYDQINMALYKFLISQGEEAQYNKGMNSYLKNKGYGQKSFNDKVRAWLKNIKKGDEPEVDVPVEVLDWVVQMFEGQIKITKAPNRQTPFFTISGTQIKVT